MNNKNKVYICVDSENKTEQLAEILMKFNQNILKVLK